MKNKEIPPVIIVGGNHHNTLGVLNSLGRKGIKSFVIIKDKHKRKCFVLTSRYVLEGYAEADSERVLQRLISLSNRFDGKCKPVVICTSDDASSLVDMHHEELEQSCFLPGTAIQGHVTELMEKTTQIKMAEDTGISVPQTWIIQSPEDINQVIYPCIVKPKASVQGSKSDIEIFACAEELKQYLDKQQDIHVIAQSYIDRDFEYQLIGCSLEEGRKVIIPGYTRIVRSSEKTNTGVLWYQSLDFDAELDKCKQLMRKIGYSGLFSMEFIRGKDGKNYFLEINFRNDGNSICVTSAGVNLPYIWCLYSRGLDYTGEANKVVKRVLVIPLVDDYFHFVKTGRIGFWTWVRELLKSDCFMDFQWKDPMPFIKRFI